MEFLKLWAESFVEIGGAFIFVMAITAFWVVPVILLVLVDVGLLALIWAVVYLIALCAYAEADSRS